MLRSWFLNSSIDYFFHINSALVLYDRDESMPTYEYQCLMCGHEFEEFQSITADALTSCPLEKCEGAVKRLISTGGGLLFKGSGFYITDYRSEGYKNSAKADTDSKSSGTDSKSSGGDGTGKTESKSSSASTPKD